MKKPVGRAEAFISGASHLVIFVCFFFCFCVISGGVGWCFEVVVVMVVAKV